MTLKLAGHKRLIEQWSGTAGLMPVLSWELLRLGIKLGFPEPPVWRVHPRQVKHGLAVRLPESSDMDVFRQIFVNEEYAGMRDLENVSTVIDLGANVGYASAFFLSCYPKSRLLAVEPDDVNFEACRANLSAYGSRVDLVRGAVWSHRTKLQLERGTKGDGLDWATQVREAEAGDVIAPAVEAWDMGSLIDRLGGGPVDLLKMDIEGAEQELFEHGADEWLPRVRNICVELHGEACEKAFVRALEGYRFDLSHGGELTFCRNIRPR